MHYISILSLLINVTAYANESTWLCIGEQLATVSEKDGVTNSDSLRNNDKFIISEEGLRRFGLGDMVSLDHCERAKDGRPTLCKRSGDRWGGTFIMTENNAFFKSGVGKSLDGATQFYWVVGMCSEL